MKNLLLCASLAAVVCAGCENMTKKDMPQATPPNKDAPQDRSQGATGRAAMGNQAGAGNQSTMGQMGANVSGQRGNVSPSEHVTPEYQSESTADRTIIQNIRQQLVKNDNLSTSAKNIKVVSQNGNIVLNGEVVSEDEKMWIDRMVKGTSGVKKLENNLMVTPD